ncbi:hypothetical protein [Bradyrhizobium sp. cf659]|uniref:hypothetical protein n=1 Tax=Bradyrhizobium sp. cf659 TaxID=1761771 RepID=UPI0008EFAC15|nr:hypothetical protein [Bradyrhizobium sp. cf659]SFK12988.1 hypothetical protein SAMN04487925_11946 [Bradyrhizobium sp. cf659]
MRTQSTISGSELLLSVIAIRLAVLVMAGWSLTLLPRQVHNSEIACLPSPSAKFEAQATAKIAGSRLADTGFDDMRLHD